MAPDLKPAETTGLQRENSSPRNGSGRLWSLMLIKKRLFICKFCFHFQIKLSDMGHFLFSIELHNNCAHLYLILREKHSRLPS